MALELNTERLLGEGKVAPVVQLPMKNFLNGQMIRLSPNGLGRCCYYESGQLFHQDIAGLLSALLRWFAEEHDSGKVLTAPFQMWLPHVQRGREPDILFFDESKSRSISINRLNGPADLVIEIVSPESILRDRGEKYGEYEIEGVREYWIIDPINQRADFFVLGTDGRYERVRPDTDGKYESLVLPGFWLNENWLWQDRLPTLRQIVQDWERG